MRDNLNTRFGKGLTDSGGKSLNRRPEHAGLKLKIGKRLYLAVYTHAALTYGQPYQINYGTTAGQELLSQAPVTSTLFHWIGVPWRAEAKGVLAWLQIRGPCKALCYGDTDITAADYLEVLNGGTYFVIDHATRTAKGCAKIGADYDDAVSAIHDIVLLGVQVNIGSS